MTFSLEMLLISSCLWEKSRSRTFMILWDSSMSSDAMKTERKVGIKSKNIPDSSLIGGMYNPSKSGVSTNRFCFRASPS